MSVNFENGGIVLPPYLFFYYFSRTIMFRNNNYGIYSYDKGVKLMNCSFERNAKYGWFADMMSFPSYSTLGYAINNDVAYHYKGNASATLSINDPWISNNRIGVSVVGTNCSIDCGRVSDNLEYGFYMGYNSVLDMQGSASSVPQVTATDNGITIGLNIAKRVDLIGGFNNLRPISGGNSFTAVNGTISPTLSCNPFPAGLDVKNNNWNSTGSFSSNDYNVTTSISANCVTPVNITLIDNSPQPGTFCGQAIPCPNCRGENALNYCPSCDDIITSNYYLEELNEASRDAIDKSSSGHGYNYVEAVRRLSEILMYNISSPDASEMYVINVSLEKLLEAFANAFMFDQLLEVDNSSTLSTEVNNVVVVLEKYIQLAINANDTKHCIASCRLHQHVCSGNIYKCYGMP
ncbi:MAG: hypothetical protein IPN54_07265 [Bacteroidetes bacterium]|nr:hypothetical protein [Bacteroidota bacterium]